ncbi:CDK-activating kinase assembly factor MAT1-domain-containing protein [Fimicolochytrium jonesii]|uniref:CDK-activating kinase assembly factor MAT1-domain-containing protein n=1 Tax=Fimicolochytrium jonesii TaxID=1396493 RepID=UPI0022FE1FA9|nr:CDK-activating kinase assembly factor MAT1-domain-containing protein [Fimicolochytrium jonesii]XP_052927379.1 CDK-activating kinase assembly factor MAT1-domain-containing protein [Fimicolochytrium jonesii]KAI8819725.1 CDK-activating kinase assembly factor MAT1-domain-containing protein [Fimicolochytrium jonesii]KAI8823197.1 CDK-activating kinase assembly factor MAT1-domain-containing protein [Fimicolochytrium jonesii]
MAAITMATLDGDICPVCKSDRYLNPHMKLLVSPCFHKMCETCINRLFLQGAAPCPICKAILKKQNFVAQTFEDLYVEKEVQIRKQIARIYNKRLEDFKGNLKAFNDYLEEVEEILFNLINEVDVKETRERVKKYEAENRDTISANIQKQIIEDRTVQGRLEREKKEKIIRRETYEQAIIEDARVKKQAKDDIINRLADEDTAASDVIANAQANRPRAVDIDQLLQQRLPAAFVESEINSYEEMDEEETRPFDPMDYSYSLPSYTTVKDAYYDPWQRHLHWEDPEKATKLKASGFTSKFVYQRAVFSAFNGIFAGL